jgi:hypothetical protein
MTPAHNDWLPLVVYHATTLLRERAGQAGAFMKVQGTKRIVDVSANGCLLVSGSEGSSLKLHDTHQDRQLRTFNYRTSLALSSAGHQR